ncbi:MAG: hypothetical protein JRI97_08455 [Deltaproteobacteria bacterium]|nr:hypothetical protein [Deltaproteobacteria bacterium]
MEIRCQDLDAHLQKQGERPAVYLVHGDEYLCAQAAKRILDALVPEEEQDFNVEVLEGDKATAGDVVEALSTYPMFAAAKVVAWIDSRVFVTGASGGELFAKAREAHGKGEQAKALRHFLDFLAAKGLSAGDLNPADPSSLPVEDEDRDLAASLAREVRERDLAVPSPSDEAETLAAGLAAGVPKANVLLITSSSVDKRKKLYKYLKESGLVVDCSVPSGRRKADKDAAESQRKAVAAQVLSPLGKTLEPAALAELEKRLNPDLRTLAAALEKLAAFVGGRKRITADDVSQVVSANRTDPIFVFTNALLDRDADESLKQLSMLLSSGFHPLQVLAAITNQLRRLVLAREFLDSDAGRAWMPGMRYPQYTQSIHPLVEGFDQELAALARDWKDRAGQGDKGKKGAVDLAISRSKSPFPAYLLLDRARRFTTAEAVSFLVQAGVCDKKMKTSGIDPRLAVESLVLAVCSPSAE